MRRRFEDYLIAEPVPAAAGPDKSLKEGGAANPESPADRADCDAVVGSVHARFAPAGELGFHRGGNTTGSARKPSPPSARRWRHCAPGAGSATTPTISWKRNSTGTNSPPHQPTFTLSMMNTTQTESYAAQSATTHLGSLHHLPTRLVCLGPSDSYRGGEGPITLAPLHLAVHPSGTGSQSRWGEQPRTRENDTLSGFAAEGTE